MCGQGDYEDGASFWAGVCPASEADVAAKFADDALADPEAEAGSLGLFRGEKRFEDFLAQLLGDAGAVVRDTDARSLACRTAGDSNADDAALGKCVDGVAD